MVSSRTIKQVQKRLAKYLPDRCAIEREVTTQDEIGGVVKAWIEVASFVSCRMLPQTGRDSKGMVAGMEEGRAYFRLIVPHDTPVEDGDRVKMADGVVYEIILVDDAWTQRAFKALTLARFG